MTRGVVSAVSVRVMASFNLGQPGTPTGAEQFLSPYESEVSRQPPGPDTHFALGS